MSALLPLSIDAVVPEPVKHFEVVDYVIVGVGIFAITFFFSAMISGISGNDFAAKYNFEAEALKSTVRDLNGTICNMICASLLLTAVAFALFGVVDWRREEKENWFLPQGRENNQWDKSWSMVALGVAAAGFALVMSALVMQNCDGMRRLNEYYNQCEHTGIGMHAVDMTQVYASMSTMAVWNGLLQATLVTGAALMAGAVGGAVYMHKKKTATSV